MNGRGRYGDRTAIERNDRGQYGRRSLPSADTRGQYGAAPHGYASHATSVGLGPIIPLGIAILAATSLTPGDVERAVKQIGTGFRQLHTEVMTEAGFSADPYREASGPIWDWWKTAGIPVIEEWQDFQADTLGSWSTRFFMRPGTLKQWHERLVKLRDVAQKRVDLKSGAPSQPEMPLPQHIYEGGGKVIEKGGEALKGAGEAAMDVVKIAKYAAIGVLAIGGAVALTSVASHLRKGTDPIESYGALAERGIKAYGGRS